MYYELISKTILLKNPPHYLTYIVQVEYNIIYTHRFAFVTFVSFGTLKIKCHDGIKTLLCCSVSANAYYINVEECEFDKFHPENVRTFYQ